MQMLDSKLWRALEGIHTLVWLIGLVSGGVAWAFSLAKDVPWYWAMAVAMIVLAAILIGYLKLWRFVGKVPLQQAAQVAYEELGGTMWRMAADKFEQTAEGRLNYFGVALVKEIPVYGKSPPSTKLELIPVGELASLHVSDGATTMKHWGENLPKYIDLAVDGVRLRSAINAMKQGARTRPLCIRHDGQ